MNEMSARTGNVVAVLGIAAAFPLLAFVAMNVMTYEMGLFDEALVPTESPFIILGGAGLGLAANLWVVWRTEGTVKDRLAARPFNATVLLVAGAFLTLLMAYLVVENLGH